MSIWLFIFSFAIFQGLFLATTLIFINRGVKQANRLLSIILVLLSLILFENLMAVANFLIDYPHLLYATGCFWYLLPPLTYFYAKARTRGAVQWKIWDLVHVLPAVFVFFRNWGFYRLDAEVKSTIASTVSPYTIVSFDSVFFVAVALGYLQAALGQLRKSGYAADSLGIVVRLLQLYVIIDLIAAIGLFLTESIFVNFSYISLVIFSLLIHAIAAMAIGYPEKLFHTRAKNGAGYVTSSLKKPEMARQARMILESMSKNKHYLKSDLSLSSLATACDLPEHHVSQILNQELATNFYDFVNQYRIEAAKAMLKDPKYGHYSILGIGLEAGFSNKASFNRAFRKFSNLTPSEFRSSHKE